MSLCYDEYLEIFNYCDHTSLFKLLLVNKNFNGVIRNVRLHEEILRIKGKSLTFTKIVKKGSLFLIKYSYDTILPKNIEGWMIQRPWEYLLKDNNKLYVGELFENSAKNGNLEVAKWLYSFDIDERKEASGFISSCEKGHLEIVKLIISKHDDYKWKNSGFYESCKNGHLEVAKWLHSRGDIDIHYNDDSAFFWSCHEQHLEVVKWLYSLGNIDIHLHRDRIFSNSCLKSCPKLAKWLYSLDTNFNIDYVYVFSKSCEYGHLEMAR